jgi:hypothetical protein
MICSFIHRLINLDRHDLEQFGLYANAGLRGIIQMAAAAADLRTIKG